MTLPWLFLGGRNKIVARLSRVALMLPFLACPFLLASGLNATAQVSSSASVPAWPPRQTAQDGASRWDIGPHSAARLIAGRTALSSSVAEERSGAQASAAPLLGLDIRMAPGWDTYWRSPGDAGLPPEIDWSGSENLASATLEWPVPERQTLLGFETFIYRDRVVLPIVARPVDPTKPVRLRAHVTYLVCETLCVPAEATLALDLESPPGTPTDLGATIASFAAKIPSRESDAVAVDHAILARGRSGLALQVSVHSQHPFVRPDLLIEGPRPMRFGRPRFDPGADGRSGAFTVPVTITGSSSAVGSTVPLTLTLVDPGQQGSPAAESRLSATGGVASSLGANLAVILLLAFGGGLILNLMPCVLPVLSMKVLAAIAHADKPLRGVRAGFFATALGIVVSMLALAGIAIGAKAAGYAVGWGVQFQSPAFLAAMTFVLVLFASSLFGFLPIALPSGVSSLAGKGPSEGLVGSFLAGAFATLLATPCTAPLLGTAVGFALARGTPEILLVFAVLGLGLAAPYLAVAAWPRLARLFPRPGPWMKWVRIVLGVALVGTALWLLTALALQVGFVAASISAFLAVAAAVLLSVRWRSVAVVAAVAAMTVAAIAAPLIVGVRPTAPLSEADDVWRPWDRVGVINEVAAGKTVLVHVTAEWCINCKVNKAVVLDRGSIAVRLKEPNTVGMIADWTRADPGISRLLADFGRYGVPFDVVYGPRAPAGIVLPEILSQDAVLKALDAASGASS